jgi:hypothetical protein
MIAAWFGRSGKPNIIKGLPIAAIQPNRLGKRARRR